MSDVTLVLAGSRTANHIGEVAGVADVQFARAGVAGVVVVITGTAMFVLFE